MEECKVVVLGSTGLIGRALVDRFQKLNNVSVVGHNSSTLDLTASEAVEKLSALTGPNVVFIIAARARRSRNQFETFRADMALLTNVARSLSRAKLRKCIYLSSASVYGDLETNLNVTEETRISPSSLYGASRYAGECLIKMACAERKIPLLMFRPCMVYGSGDTSDSYGPTRFVQSLLKHGRIELLGDGSELRDYVYIDDLAEIIVRLAPGNERDIFNVATGKSHTFQDLVRALQTFSEDPFEVVHLERQRPPTHLHMNPRKLNSALKNLQFTPLEQGLRTTYESFVAKSYGRPD